ncbi:MAG: hypothetical protein ACK40G_15435 [Cytophagaceae bacterium]
MRKSLIMPVLAAFFLYSCNFSPKEKVAPAWETEILGPLVKTDLTTENIFDLGDMDLSFSFGLSDLGMTIPPTPTVVPAIPPTDFPEESAELSNSFASLEIESGDIQFVIVNNLEIPINQGMQVVMKSNNNSIIQQSLPAIPANGGSFTLNPPISLANKTLLPQVTFQLKNFSSPGSNGQVVTLKPDSRISIDIYFRNIKIKSLSANANNIFELGDTLDFDLRANVIKASAGSGVINTYVNNGMPLDFKFQVYFLSENFTVIDSLFENSTTVTAAPKDFSGQATSSVESKLTTTVNEDRINKLKQVYYAVPYFKTMIFGNVKIRKEDFVGVQLVGDLKININQ